MDGLLFLGCIVLFFAIVVVPILAITALSRTSRLRDELHHLRQRINALELNSARSDAVAPDTPAPEEVVQPVTIPAEPEAVIVAQKAEIKNEEPAHIAVPQAEEQPSSQVFSGMLSSLIRWFMQGNPLAKLGVLLLFVGLSFLLRYSVEHALLPLELRLVFTGLAAVALLIVGWRLRHRQSVYALILQGGASGILYLTVFGAFRLWQMLPMPLAFTLLVVICAASVGLAVLQKALSLAMLASLGGYLAPLLLSTGNGSHIALFSFYLLISSGILCISIWQNWRELNLLGLLLTFGVGGIWGLSDYRPEYYLSCQLFLIANIALFGVLSVMFTLRTQRKGGLIVDGVLLFGPPLIGFAMQYAITSDMRWGPALSALGYGAFYIALAWLIQKRFPSAGRMLVLATLVLGAVFSTLAIPLALSARWTAIAWALEGVGILWLGMQQHQRRMCYSGTGLLLLALMSALSALTESSTPITLLLIFSVLSLCWLAAGWIWYRLQMAPLSQMMLTGGILFWLAALSGGAQLIIGDNRHTLFVALTLLALSVWIWRFAANRLAWRTMRYAVWLLWPAMALLLLTQIADRHLFSAGVDNLAWMVALPSALFLLYFEDERLSDRLSPWLYLTLFWMLQLALGVELWWFSSGLSWGMEPWGAGVIMTAGAALIAGTYLAINRSFWPFSRWPTFFSIVGVAPVMAVLVLMLVFSNLQDGVMLHWEYIPLVNPLEEGAGFALLALWAFSQRLIPTVPDSTQARQLARLVCGGMLFWWLNGMLMRSLSWYGEITWSIEALWHSRLVQTAFALFWMMIALIVMVQATKHHLRSQWFTGAGLLGIVIVKLMLVDSAGGGGLARAISFIGVALLVLIIGYFSPLPPKRIPTAQTGDENERD